MTKHQDSLFGNFIKKLGLTQKCGFKINTFTKSDEEPNYDRIIHMIT